MNGIGMLTEKQEAILDFIRQYQATERVPPSSRIIQSNFNLRSQSTVVQHLGALAKKGFLEQLADGRWAVKTNEFQGTLFEAPLFGSIPAGFPAMREQEAEDKVCIDPAIFGIKAPKKDQLWFLRVTGDSMIDAGIMDGDIVALVRRDPKLGDVVAALVDETSVTLKRMIKERGRIILRAANSKYADITPKRIESQGVMVGLIRRKIL